MTQRDQTDDADFASTVETVVQAGMADPVFRRAWLLAHRHGLDVATTLHWVHTFVTAPTGIRWDRLSHPPVERCHAIAACARRVAGALVQAPQDAAVWRDELAALQDGETLMVYAALREILPCSFDEVVATLGDAATASRLMAFADAVDLDLTVG